MKPFLGISRHNYRKVRDAEREISRLEALGLSYGFGGGRNCGSRPCRYEQRPANGIGGDCSWGQLLICDILGVSIKDWLGSTYSLATEGESGDGRVFTILIKNPPDPHEAHTIGRFQHRLHTHYFEVGGSDNPKPGNGFAWIRPTSERVAEFPIHRHFRGF